MFQRKNKKKKANLFKVVIHNGAITEQTPTKINPVIEDNIDIVQAETDKHGILQRIDDFTGENINDELTFKPKEEKVVEEEDIAERFMPGERLLMTIREEKPELLYKKITTRRRNKLKAISEKISPDGE